MADKKLSRRVVGLRYEPGAGLPRVVLKGGGDQADAVLKQVRRTGGPVVVKDESLVKQLYRLPVDAEIGRDLFELVAILLVHVFAIDEKNKGES